MTMTHELVPAEVAYRLDRATRSFGRVQPTRTHHVPRRPALSLPRPRRRPLSLA